MKPRVNVLGCIAGLAIFIALIYAGVAGLGFLWWGRGFAGALAGRHRPESVRNASRIAIYDHVILVERDRVVFRRSLWASARFASLLGIAASVVTLLLRRKRLALGAGVAIAVLTFAISRSRAHDVVLPRGAPRNVVMTTYDYGGGRSGTRNTTAMQTGYAIVDAETSQVLVRLPWNEEPDARFWRDLVAEKIAH